MDNQILEYIEYNVKSNKNEEIIELLRISIDNFNEDIPVEIKNPIVTAYGLANGWLEYRVKDFANDTGLSRTAVKTQVKNLEAEGLIKIHKEETITFIILNKTKI